MDREITVTVVDASRMEVSSEEEKAEINALLEFKDQMFPELRTDTFEVPRDILVKHSLAYDRDVMSKRNMNPEYVRKLPLVKQKLYADGVTKQYAHVPAFRRKKTHTPQIALKSLNACQIGNLAYLTKYEPQLVTFLDELRTLPSLEGVNRQIPRN